MKKETEEVLDAPYTLKEHSYGVYDKWGDEIAWASEEWDRNRILRIPELYDALSCAVVKSCLECDLEEHEPNDECKKCIVYTWIELLRKIKDGK